MNLTKLKKQAKLNKVHILARILTNAHLVQIILQGFGQAAPLQFLVEDHLEFLPFQFVYCFGQAAPVQFLVKDHLEVEQMPDKAANKLGCYILYKWLE